MSAFFRKKESNMIQQKATFRGGNANSKLTNSFFKFIIGAVVPISRRSRTMLATCTLLLFSLGGLRAQSNAEYTFRQQFTDDGDRFNSSTDDAPILSMDCLAANGYGQWTLSSTAGTGTTDPTSSTNFVEGWYLLANGLYKPTASFISGTTLGCIPPGVVEDNVLDTIPTQPMATADLDGAENFCSPDQNTLPTARNAFAVREFARTDVDISLGFCTSPKAPTGSRPWHNDIIKNTISSFWIPTGSHPVVSEADFR